MADDHGYEAAKAPADLTDAVRKLYERDKDTIKVDPKPTKIMKRPDIKRESN